MSQPHVITGMSAIVNPENIRPNIAIKDLEREMLNGGYLQQQTRDPSDRLAEVMQQAAKELGVDFGQDEQKTAFNGSSNGQSPRSFGADSRPFGASVLNPAQYDEEENSASDSDSDDEDDEQRGPNSGGDSSSYYAPQTSSFGSDLRHKTEEQRRKSHIENILGKSNENVSLEKEKREDHKCAMLAEIDSLISSMEDSDVDLSRISRVTKDDSYESIEATLTILRHKQDHTRYCSFAEELIVMGACGLEELFDGKKVWFGYSPDLTDWNRDVKLKFKRVRCDLSNVVSSSMANYNIGPWWRILLEFFPSAIMHSRTRKKQSRQIDLFNDEAMAHANHRLRE